MIKESKKIKIKIFFFSPLVIMISSLFSSCALLSLLEESETIDLNNSKTFWIDSSGFMNRRISIGGTAIHYIDYGGEGTTLIFLAGLGNSAHIFDEFAPKFTNDFHVIAITRRGFGESGKSKDGYETERLAADIKDLIDSLQLDKIVLVGHSIAGDEISEFAARFPNRAEAIIYLDAAYDRSGSTMRLMTLALLGYAPPTPPAPDDDEKFSQQNYREYLKKIYGVYWPVSEVTAIKKFDSSGYFEKDVAPASVNLKIVQGENEPIYSKIKIPALAFYSTERNLETDFSWTADMFIGRGAIETKAMRYLHAQQNWEKEQREKLKEELEGVKIIEVRGASHYVFISHPNLIEQEIRMFLTKNISGNNLYHKNNKKE